MRDPMLDEEFLKRLDKFKHRFIWTKILALNMEEDPIDEIAGKITSGSINIDGTSAVRRTCSLSFVAEKADINNFYGGLNTKVKIYIGLENHIDDRYPDIIGFNQGMFLITSFSCNESVNSFSVSISCRDKMALLNGDLGGVIPASGDFASEDVTQEDGTIQNNLIPIKDIVLQAVHEYAQEPWQNIIVKDLDDLGVEILEYIGEKPLYFFCYDEKYTDTTGIAHTRIAIQNYSGDDKCEILTGSGDEKNNCIDESHGKGKTIKMSEIADDRGDGIKYSYDKNIGKLSLNDEITVSKETYYPALIRMLKADNSEEYNYGTVIRINSNDGTQVCGYRETEIVYPYDLIAAPGETVTSVLDKLVNMLGDFEYFYDVDGRFIFQRKKIYQNVSYNNLVDEHNIYEETGADSDQFNSKYAYVFDDSEMVMSVQNSPDLSNIKNDYSLWGSRDVGEVSVPIHARYAIDHKPLGYKTFDEKVYCTDEGWQEYQRVINTKGYNKETGDSYKEQRVKGVGERFSEMRKNYPKGMREEDFDRNEENDKEKNNEESNTLRDGGKLSDWGNLFENLVGEIPNNVTMGSGKNTILDNIYFDKLDTFCLKNGESRIFIFPEDKKSVKNFNVIDTNKDLTVVYNGHGTGCSHFYDSLLKEQDKIIGIYDPRIGNSEKIREESSSIGTNKVSEKMTGIIDESQVIKVDGREIIYQMAQDYRRHYRDDNFLITVRDNNKGTPKDGLYPKGYTGYERYYIDFEMNLSQGVVAYWRELYNPDAAGQKGSYDANGWHEYEENAKGEVVHPADFIYDANGWNAQIFTNPEMLNFGFDFLDTTGELNKYSIPNIGLRSKATNDDKIKAIYFRDIPNIIFYKPDEEPKKIGYTYFQLPDSYSGLFAISARGKCAMDVIDEYLYDYTYPASAVSLTTVPIYYLSPNTLIYINDKETGMVGEYIAQKFSYQLGLSAQMSVSAVETAKRIY